MLFGSLLESSVPIDLFLGTIEYTVSSKCALNYVLQVLIFLKNNCFLR